MGLQIHLIDMYRVLVPIYHTGNKATEKGSERNCLTHAYICASCGLAGPGLPNFAEMPCHLPRCAPKDESSQRLCPVHMELPRFF